MLEDAAQEDGHGELHDSDDDLLEASEEEDEDLVQSPQRMPNPGLSGSDRVMPEDPRSIDSRKRSNSATFDLPSSTQDGDGNSGDAGTGSNSHIRTRTGVRPSVAFQMQEMEGRPSADDPEYITDGKDGSEKESSSESNGKSESNFVQEYIVSSIRESRRLQAFS